MKTKLLIVVSLCLMAMVSAGTATAQVSCAGLPAFASCTTYATGTSVTYNGSKYTSIAPIASNRDCPPNSPYNPGNDNWWTNMGTCTTGATATATATATRTNTATSTPTGPTATRTNTATATRTPTATATGSRATATSTSTATRTATATATSATATPTSVGGGGTHRGAYFAQWGIYARAYFVSNIPSGVDRVYYAFNNPHNGQCELGVNQAGVGDQWADYGDPLSGEAYNAPLKGNFHALQLKYGGKGVSISIGGWTWSDGYYNASPTTLVASCIDKFVKGNIPLVAGQGGPGTAANIFDGIDLDWEYPGVCGNNPSCAASSGDKANYVAIAKEFRKEMDAAKAGMTLSAFVSADPVKIATGYDIANLSAPMNLVNIQGYDFFGAWAPTGPTAPHAPLFQFAGQASYTPPLDKFYVDAAVQTWIAGGAPRNKIEIGIPAYARGWIGSFSGTGLNQPATGAASGTYDPGVTDYKVVIGQCPANNTGAGTAWCNGGSQWWGFDTPATVGTKKTYQRTTQGLAGMYLWSLDGDNGQILAAMQ
jgi:chitinase